MDGFEPALLTMLRTKEHTNFKVEKHDIFFVNKFDKNQKKGSFLTNIKDLYFEQHFQF